MQRTSFKTLAALTGALGTGMAMAVSNGITNPAPGQVINPYTGQEIQAWKLVGALGASAVQIHRNWLVMAGHEGNATGMSFSNAQSNGTTATLGTCYPHPNYVPGPSGNTSKYDIQLCRLNQPLDGYGTFPALVVAPADIQPTSQLYSTLYGDRSTLRGKVAKWGYLMAYGYAWASPGLAITDFGGTPLSYQPALGSSAPGIPRITGGDSGGAAYWISPTSTEVALIGVLTSDNLVPDGISYFTQSTLDWIQSTITGAGDSPVTILTASQHYSGTSDLATPELPALPTIRSVNNSRSNFTMSWPAQAPQTPAITSYQVSLGHNGAVVQQLSVAAGQGNNTSFNALSGVYIACAKGNGTVGSALPAYPVPYKFFNQIQSISIETPNCKTFDTTTAAPGSASGLSATASSAGTVSQVAFNWSAATPTPAAYRLKLTQSYAGGPSRTTNVESSTTSYTATVLKGTTVCATVTPLNDIGITGTATSNVCATTN